ncbi:grasp-with-spasm system A modified peptide [Chryseobacterium oryctis]|uniref:Grasp-with-spasm system A modified peptide n=1 Tax=Chryseobacterium oryctis TaxID=2952618 RepID=A0ABT3HJG8_9FLAO|nr:grasp-with-spasm system A modified peptide [Chryseobacterium oryctis]MCW3159931.1 grasp-with-spasm system A modified peptide [Chryseobacterium oryctis]
MKKLKGMKSNFSSLENKKLENLQSVKGGSASSRKSPSNAGGAVDQDYYTDDGSGNWKWVGRHTLSFEEN